MLSFRIIAFHRARFLMCPAVLALSLTGMAPGQKNRENSVTPEQREVLEPLQRVLDGIESRNKDEVRNQLLPGGMATLLRQGQILQLSFDAFVDRIPGGTQQLEERIHDPQIRIDDGIAIIWAPYEFLIDGRVDHRGTDVVNLVRSNGRWLIAGIADNSRRVQSSEPAGQEH